VSHDAASDTTTARIKPGMLGSAGLFAGSTFPGREARTAPDQVLIGLRQSGGAARLEGCERLTLQGDGAPLEVPATRDVQLGGGQISEFLSGLVPYAAARALAWSGKLTLRACGATLVVAPEEHELLRQLLTRLTPR